MGRQKSIGVIDLKAFYAFVECVDRGLDPWKTPLIVADNTRGTNTIILSVSPFLKARGVPSRLRVKDLPKGFKYIYATPRMSRYIEMSGEVVSIILDFVSQEDIHIYSIDEAFIDLTTYLDFYKKTPYEIVKMIIDEIKERTELQATAGIGDNFFLSKVALDIYAKHEPEGIAVLRKEDVEKKLWPITPLIKIWGIGPATERKLNAMGLFDMYDVAHANRDVFRAEFGILGDQLIDQANGVDESDIREVYVPKETSITCGQTLFRDYSVEEAKLLLREMNDDLSAKLRSQNQLTRVVHLYVGYSGEQGGFGRQKTLYQPTSDSDTILETLYDIYSEFVENLPIRRLSICYGQLSNNERFEQVSLLEDNESLDKKRHLQETIDEIHNKYGKDILLRASALTEGSNVLERHSYIGGHKK